MADDTIVRAHIRRALAAQATEQDVLRRLTKAFRLLQAERCAPGGARDEDLTAAEYYFFARQAVASNAVSLKQMLLMVAENDTLQHASQRIGPGGTPLASCDDAPSQDSIGWGVAGAMLGETDRQIYLPGSTPPPFKPAFMGARL
ncbi:hypothetical protein [Reyranella sp. CPCC 100927]|uniref:hypothetical protein n=1 Tax=Reyranella sp. CPCC 100927 TaxID=2599616 RepID=UPI0011B3B777|nr:hypothetical protein [Reyranella sp. CPCC 100927]TWT09943.1 hypothetical protein FQU96_17770 [Reyranella sp. CPCC 100927]